ncbi:MAG TPA: hypothetical protein VFR17_13355 [Mycobacterium sp.]|nr:hypothetical protein [Mycobacterium sp.]
MGRRHDGLLKCERWLERLGFFRFRVDNGDGSPVGVEGFYCDLMPSDDPEARLRTNADEGPSNEQRQLVRAATRC